jgi:hypothetical protein
MPVRMDDLEGEQEAQLEKARMNITPWFASPSTAGVFMPGVPRQDRCALRSSARMRITHFLCSFGSALAGGTACKIVLRCMARIVRIVRFMRVVFYRKIAYISTVGKAKGANN